MRIKEKIWIMMILIAMVANFFNIEVKASENNVNECEINIESVVQPRGYYLAEGTSSISKTGTYTINATGVTNAARKCDVSVLVTVEQFRNDKWYFYTSWQTSKENAFAAAISNTIYVDLGYFYRVVSVHGAGTDSSSSFTNAIWMGL